jgi:hypothetical protein
MEITRKYTIAVVTAAILPFGSALRSGRKNANTYRHAGIHS